MATSSSSPCAACKFLRRKCTAECVFAPYFPPDQPQKFANVHKVFGASNITKLLNELPPHKREDAVNSLAYEADARIKDPVYGCVGAISILQRQVAQLQQELAIAQSDLARLSSSSPTAMPLAIASPSSASTIGGGSPASSLVHHHHHGHHHHHHLSTMGLSPPSPTTLLAQPASITQQQHLLMMHNRYHARDAVQQLLDQLQRDTLLTREQLIDQLTRVGGGSLEAGLAALGNMSFIPRSSSDGGSGSSGGNLGHLSPP